MPRTFLLGVGTGEEGRMGATVAIVVERGGTYGGEDATVW